MREYITKLNEGMEDRIERWIRLNKRDSQQDTIRSELESFREKIKTLVMKAGGINE